MESEMVERRRYIGVWPCSACLSVPAIGQIGCWVPRFNDALYARLPCRPLRVEFAVLPEPIQFA